MLRKIKYRTEDADAEGRLDTLYTLDEWGDSVPRIHCAYCGDAATQSLLSTEEPCCDECAAFDESHHAEQENADTDSTRSAMVEVAQDYKCELCGARSMMETCFICAVGAEQIIMGGK